MRAFTPILTLFCVALSVLFSLPTLVPLWPCREKNYGTTLSPWRGPFKGREGQWLLLDRLPRQRKNARREGGRLPRKGRQRQG